MEKDILERKKFVDQVINMINNMVARKRGYTFAIDGRWGCGKSFVLEMIKKEISIFETVGNKAIDDKNKYFLFNYNCWEYDYYDEPLVAIIAALGESIKKYKQLIDYKYEKINNFWDEITKVTEILLKQFVRNKVGIDVEKIKYAVSEKGNDFDTYLTLKTTIEKIRKAIKELAEGKPIIIVVDELDRCLPEYAIKVLERLHHIFYGIDNVIVIMAVDNKQLDNTVKKIFGDSSDTDKYLKKFIDFKLFLDQGKHAEDFLEKFDFYFNKFEIEDESEFRDCLISLFRYTRIRDQEKIIKKADLIHSICINEEKTESICLFELLYLILKIEEENEDGVKWLVNYIWKGESISDHIMEKEEKYEMFIKDICHSKIYDTRYEWDQSIIVKLFERDLCGSALYYLVFTEEEYIKKQKYMFKINGFLENTELSFVKLFASMAKII